MSPWRPALLLLLFIVGGLRGAEAASSQWYVDAVIKGVYCGFPTQCPANDLRPFTGTFTYDPATGAVSNVALQYRGATWTFGRRVSSRALAFHPASSANYTGSNYIQIYLAPGWEDNAGTYAVGPYPWTQPASINEAQCLNSTCTTNSQVNADGISGQVSRMRIDAVDANTAQLRGFVTGTASFPALVAASAANGLVADGVTRLILRWQGTSANPVAISITDEGSGTADIGTLSCVAGTICTLGSPTAATVTPVQAANGSYIAAVVLVAPMEFVRNLADESKGAQSPRQIRLRAEVTGDTGTPPLQPVTGQLELHRPPLVLLHGLWSSGTTWNLGVQQDARFFVNQPFDYRYTNAAPFVVNLAVPRAAVADAV
ncbi:MAG: hypothetical protein OEW72_07685, partial [Gammaproteobacteria bacterium]|nr:hypothetical protein [Gammaproteobacteria bacterium]